MRPNMQSQITVAQHEANFQTQQEPLESAPLSKSKQLLKKCISDIESSKQGRTPSHQLSSVNNLERTGAQLHNKIKIAAPKPIRARPLGLTHVTSTSKWLETSPIKSENKEASEDKDENDILKSLKHGSSTLVDFLNIPHLNFQIEQNLSYENDSSKIQRENNISQISELKSIMEAEQELNEIFSQSKNRQSDFSQLYGNPQYNTGFQAHFSPDKSIESNHNQINNNKKPNQSKDNLEEEFQVGFSKFGHFKAPLKRPQCNPMVKDERFRRLNNELNVNNKQSNYNNLINTQESITDCNSQDVYSLPNANYMYNYNNQRKLYYNGLQDLDSYDCSQYMFGFSQTTSPTGCSSRLQPFNSMMDHSGNYSSQIPHMNQSIYYQPNVNSHMQANDFYTQQMQMQSQTQYNLQIQFASMNLSNSAPEYQNSYLNMFSGVQQTYPDYGQGLFSDERDNQDQLSHSQNCQQLFGTLSQEFTLNQANEDQDQLKFQFESSVQKVIQQPEPITLFGDNGKDE